MLTAIPTVNQEDVRRFQKAMRDFDPELLKRYRKELKTGLGPFAKSIKTKVPSAAPLSGMRGEGRLAFPSRLSATVTSSTAKRRGKNVNALVAIKIGGGAYDAGLQMAGLAGTRSKGLGGMTSSYPYKSGSRSHMTTTQGQHMIRVLNSRFPSVRGGSRFAFPAFLKGRPEIVDEATKVLEKYIREVNKTIGG